MAVFGTTDKRPSAGDKGKRVWVWLLPGTHPSQIMLGVLAGWDKGQLILESGHAHEWVTIKEWGFGDPPDQLP